MIYFETERLIARDWCDTDTEMLIKMNSDKEVMKYFLEIKNREEILSDLKIIKDEIETYGYGLFAFEEKASGSFIGYLGLHHITFDVDFAPAIEIAWRFDKMYWNRGYATERAIKCFQFAKEQCQLKNIYAFTSLLNKPSQRVMQKSGMEYVKQFNHPSVPREHPLLEHVLYRMELY